MATTNEKVEPATTTSAADSPPAYDGNERGQPARSTGWMYKSRRVGGIKIPAYASPPVQLGVVAFVCFLCPGMFNAVTGLGGAGQLDATTANNANVAVYSTFSVIGFFAGTFTNRMGIKLTLSFGGIGYFFYTASFLSYNHNQNAGFPIFAGALTGVCAGLLWSAQGAIMMSYPPEASKGRYISWFWMIFNLGAVIGSLIPLGQNIHSQTSGAVSDGTYAAFMVLNFLGAVLAWSLVDARNVQRADGSHVVLMKHPTWQSELLGLWETLRTDSWIVFLFPMFFASNWFYTYQFNGVNLAKFNVRTRALNNVLYWTSQIIGAYVFGYALDIDRVRRTTRAKAAWVGMFVITMAIWGGGYAWQKQYTRAEVSAEDFVPEDWTTSGYVGPMFLYMFYGFYDAAWQTCVYWFMGALTNNGRKLANFAGFYKGIQSAAAAIIFRIDALKAPYMNEFASCWALLAGSLVIALPLIVMKVRDTIPLEEDLKFSDETIEDVMPTEGLPEAHNEKA
ncbi:MAG: hypothetical protein LQ351_005591 [Letrouitia transgressa]|nr:MAG: hypothetical protein LQ351_005591 [Letrouitia transgressa]